LNWLVPPGRSMIPDPGNPPPGSAVSLIGTGSGGSLPGRRAQARSGRAFELMRNWISAFTSTRDFVLEDGGLGRLPLEWREGMPRWLNVLRPILSLG